MKRIENRSVVDGESSTASSHAFLIKFTKNMLSPSSSFSICKFEVMSSSISSYRVHAKFKKFLSSLDKFKTRSTFFEIEFAFGKKVLGSASLN